MLSYVLDTALLSVAYTCLKIQWAGIQQGCAADGTRNKGPTLHLNEWTGKKVVKIIE